MPDARHEARPPTGEITDPRAMRALAHPLRLALLDLLAVEGAATATRCAELLGESQASCSFHLRQLAKYGFVEEAQPASWRERPWRLTSVSRRWSSVQPDPAGILAAAELGQVFVEREAARLLAWHRTVTAWPPAWQQAARVSTTPVWLTAAELEEVTARLIEVAVEVEDRRRERVDDPASRPADARPVQLLVAGYPLPGSEPVDEG
jgi:DNA-binding transcriptional ArsR family regulator